MKNSIFIFIFTLFVLTSCHKEDDKLDNNDSILGVWYQTVGDNTHWISFSCYVSEHGNSYGCNYTVTPKGADPYQFLWDTKGTYSVDNDNKIKIYDLIPGEPYFTEKIWLSGYISNSTVFLNNESESYQLTKYIK